MSVKINEFPSLAERTRVSTLRKFSKLYDNEQMAVLNLHEIIKNQYKNVEDLVYLAHAVPYRITEFYGDFVQGDVDRMIIQAGTGNEADEEWVEKVVYVNDLKESVSDYAEDQSEFGFVVFQGYTDDEGNYYINTVAGDQYFPQADGSVVFVTYKKDPAYPDSKHLLMHTQHYKQEGDDVIIEHEAFRADNHGVAIEAYSLEKMGELVGRKLQEEEKIEGLDELPIRVAHNGRVASTGFGYSDYYHVMPQLTEVNERATHASTQFLKNIDAKMVVPESAFDEDGKMKHAEAYAIESKDDPVPQYITNENPLLESMNEHVMQQLKMIEWVTSVPMWALTKGSQAEKVESLRIQLFGAMRKTLKKRSKIKRAMLDMVRIGAKMTEQSEELQENDIVIDFSDALPVDEMAQVEAESAKVTAGISSKKRAIMRVENYTEEEAEEELEAIKGEDQIAGVGDINNAPTV